MRYTTCSLKCLFIAAYGRFTFACWQTCGYFNKLSDNSQQKNGQKLPKILAALSVVERVYHQESTFFSHPT
jgi:hypothetical protein